MHSMLVSSGGGLIQENMYNCEGFLFPVDVGGGLDSAASPTKETSMHVPMELEAKRSLQSNYRRRACSHAGNSINIRNESAGSKNTRGSPLLLNTVSPRF